MSSGASCSLQGVLVLCTSLDLSPLPLFSASMQVLAIFQHSQKFKFPSVFCYCCTFIFPHTLFFQCLSLHESRYQAKCAIDLLHKDFPGVPASSIDSCALCIRLFAYLPFSSPVIHLLIPCPLDFNPLPPPPSALTILMASGYRGSMRTPLLVATLSTSSLSAARLISFPFRSATQSRKSKSTQHCCSFLQKRSCSSATGASVPRRGGKRNVSG